MSYQQFISLQNTAGNFLKNTIGFFLKDTVGNFLKNQNYNVLLYSSITSLAISIVIALIMSRIAWFFQKGDLKKDPSGYLVHSMMNAAGSLSCLCLLFPIITGYIYIKNI